MTDLDTKLGGVLGGRTASAFAKAFGIQTVGDLVNHYPRRYARRGELTALSQLPLNEDVTIVAEVREVRKRPMKARKGSIVEAKISDGTGVLTLTFFNQPWREGDLTPGTRGIFAGKVSDYHGSLQLTHPDYELFDDDLPSEPDSARRWAETLIPIYPATGSVASWQVHNAMALALDSLGTIADPVPEEVRSVRGLVSFDQALRWIHRPETELEVTRAREALRFHEAFVLQSALLQQRANARQEHAVPRVPAAGGYLERFDAALPFELTADQRRVSAEIARDLSLGTPMNRLLQGEVGSGKTVVALRGMLAVADSGGQSALLAPTEVLAGQHLRSIVRVLGPDLAAELMPTLLTGQLSTAQRKKALLRTVSGQARIVIGTHALISPTVTFYDLGLVVVDEQHRFGVEQREALRLKGASPPHVLVMTATPIPRTVAMTVFGDLDVSTIAELPIGRQRIESFVVPLAEKPGWMNRVWERVSEEVAQGRQVFVVCPAISAKEVEDDGSGLPQEPAEAAIATVEDTAALIRENPHLASARVQSLHGRMPSDHKDEVMLGFAAGAIDVLVATTVIEVGVDVPNASAMVVLDADRFGVSQLHQLRGRVGRGGVPGLCLFVVRAAKETVARERVEAVAATLDGFQLAQVDLELRREGDVLGARQSGGRSSLRLLHVAHDGEIISDARAAARALLDVDPGFAEHDALRAALTRRLDAETRPFLGKN